MRICEANIKFGRPAGLSEFEKKILNSKPIKKSEVKQTQLYEARRRQRSLAAGLAAEWIRAKYTEMQLHSMGPKAILTVGRALIGLSAGRGEGIAQRGATNNAHKNAIRLSSASATTEYYHGFFLAAVVGYASHRMVRLGRGLGLDSLRRIKTALFASAGQASYLHMFVGNAMELRSSPDGLRLMSMCVRGGMCVRAQEARQQDERWR